MATEIQTTFAQAVEHHRAGRRADAERLYRQVLAGDPNHRDGLFLLAGIELESGRAQDAVDKLLRATALAPDNAAYFANLGEAYRRLGRPDDALRALLRAMALQPDRVEPLFNLAVLMEDSGVMDAAVAFFERAAQLRPDTPMFADRLARARRAAARIAARGEDRVGPASDGSARMMVVFAGHLCGLGAREQGEAFLRRAVALSPGLAEAHSALGVVLGDLSRLDEAIASFRRALALKPDAADTLANLGGALASSGLVGEGVDAMRESVSRSPNPVSHSNLLMTMLYDSRATPADILAESREYERVHARTLGADVEPHRNDPSPDRRLRIGYVSPDFRREGVSFFLVPVLSHHDRRDFEIFCYSSVARPDEVTQRLMGYADHWRNLLGVDDASAARTVRADGIDVLVDLTMHAGNNRMLLFARKAAPVQVCWVGYPGTTGLSAMQVRLSDPYLDPGDGDCPEYSEKTVRLPDTFWCYDPLTSELEAGPLPALARGAVTFGCLNKFDKVSPETLDLWGRVLRQVPGSLLVLLAPLGAARGRVAEALAKYGIDRDRIEFADRRPRAEYLASYRNIDVCLDTVPVNGHTTSLDAFWMGVPVVTLVGKTIIGRAGLSLATNLGLSELVSTTPDEFVRIAVGLAGDLRRMSELRAGLRARMKKSPLMDAPRFARALEALYRRLWKDWCRV
jgi:predicted O-linked N-acetylglucosamine transferase (SPINDLY family)